MPPSKKTESAAPASQPLLPEGGQASADGVASDGTPVVRLDPQAIARSSYLGYRIAALRAEVEALVAERAEVVARLREVSDARSPEAKELKRRRAYLEARPKEARLEIQALFDERKALTRPPE